MICWRCNAPIIRRIKSLTFCDNMHWSHRSVFSVTTTPHFVKCVTQIAGKIARGYQFISIVGTHGCGRYTSAMFTARILKISHVTISKQDTMNKAQSAILNAMLVAVRGKQSIIILRDDSVGGVNHNEVIDNIYAWLSGDAFAPPLLNESGVAAIASCYAELAKDIDGDASRCNLKTAMHHAICARVRANLKIISCCVVDDSVVDTTTGKKNWCVIFSSVGSIESMNTKHSFSCLITSC